MAPTIEELDATVRGFYEGRGDSVSIHGLKSSLPTGWGCLLTRCVYSKKLLRLLSTRYDLLRLRSSYIKANG